MGKAKSNSPAISKRRKTKHKYECDFELLSETDQVAQASLLIIAVQFVISKMGRKPSGEGGTITRAPK